MLRDVLPLSDAGDPELPELHLAVSDDSSGPIPQGDGQEDEEEDTGKRERRGSEGSAKRECVMASMHMPQVVVRRRRKT